MDQVAIDYIKKSRESGSSDEAIKALLLSTGHDQASIDTAFNAVNAEFYWKNMDPTSTPAPSLMDQEVIRYIKGSRELGRSDEDIKALLLNSGHNEASIDAAFNMVNVEFYWKNMNPMSAESSPGPGGTDKSVLQAKSNLLMKIKSLLSRSRNRGQKPEV